MEILQLHHQAATPQKPLSETNPIPTSLTAAGEIDIPPGSEWVDWYIDLENNVGGTPVDTVDGYIDVRGNPEGAWRPLFVEEIASGVATQFDYNWSKDSLSGDDSIKITTPAEGSRMRIRLKGNNSPDGSSIIKVSAVVR